MWQRQVFAADAGFSLAARLSGGRRTTRTDADACAYGRTDGGRTDRRRRWRRRRYEVGRASGLGAAGSTAGGDDDDTDAGVAAARCSTIAGSEQPKLGAAPPPRSLAS